MKLPSPRLLRAVDRMLDSNDPWRALLNLSRWAMLLDEDDRETLCERIRSFVRSLED